MFAKKVQVLTFGGLKIDTQIHYNLGTGFTFRSLFYFFREIIRRPLRTTRASTLK